eukprot:35895-Hanusia_phi.AAC.1
MPAAPLNAPRIPQRSSGTGFPSVPSSPCCFPRYRNDLELSKRTPAVSELRGTGTCLGRRRRRFPTG